jgi:hypothetical protein
VDASTEPRTMTPPWGWLSAVIRSVICQHLSHGQDGFEFWIHESAIQIPPTRHYQTSLYSRVALSEC